MHARFASLVGLASVFSVVAGQLAAAQAVADPATQEQRVAALEKSLSGATLVGQFTVTGAAPLKPAEERYELGRVEHLGGESWMFQTRIRYGEHDVSLPLTVAIRWAGDTPVVCVDELTVPGLGTYTARVIFYQEHYAGFWTAKDHGGHLFGVIERKAAAEGSATTPSTPSAVEKSVEEPAGSSPSDEAP